MNNFQEIIDYSIRHLSKGHREDTVKAVVSGVYYAYGMEVEGDIAEFGTMTGRTAVAMATAQKILMERYAHSPIKRKKLWFLDSFVGLPEVENDVDSNSPHVKSQIWGPGTCKGLSFEEFSNLIAQIISKEEFEVLEGWYSDTAASLTKEKFALVHVDCDLYESTMDALVPLFQNGCISEGCLFLFDDWNCNHASNDFGERKAWEELTKEFNIEASDEGNYSIASKKFIIHNYSYS